MQIKDINQYIKGYSNYFTFMYDAKTYFYKNKHLKEIEIRRMSEKYPLIDKKLITFYFGEIKNGLSVTIHVPVPKELVFEFKNQNINFIEDKKKTTIKTIEEIHLFFKCLEKTDFFIKK